MLTFRRYALFLVQTSLDNPVIVAKPVIYSAVRMKAGLSSFPKNVLARPRHMHALRWWPC
jgi:hypothetical protein